MSANDLARTLWTLLNPTARPFSKASKAKHSRCKGAAIAVMDQVQLEWIAQRRPRPAATT
jgi:hypothetical protein